MDAEGGVRPVAATPHGAKAGLARDNGRHAPAASTPGRRRGPGCLPAATTPRRAVIGLARESGRHALASDHAKTEGVAGHHHTTRSRSRTRPRQWAARTGQPLPAADTPCGAFLGLARNGGRRAPARQPQARSPAAGKPADKLCTPHRCWACKRERRTRCLTAGKPAAKLRASLHCMTIPKN